jgi:hypothetical protein
MTTNRNEIYLGGGIKFPTGVNKVDPNDRDFNIGDFNSQAGTGSVDFLVTATHNLIWNRSGVVTNAAYRINTANQQAYRFGNRTYLSTSYYYTLKSGSVKILPNVGFNFQSNGINTLGGTEVEDSNGYNLSSTIGQDRGECYGICSPCPGHVCRANETAVEGGTRAYVFILVSEIESMK